ncbi:hypothetical protein [Sphaerotilus mobilis]|nr:hypothetical protein [Sphaerotilus mobilis]
MRKPPASAGGVEGAAAAGAAAGAGAGGGAGSPDEPARSISSARNRVSD